MDKWANYLISKVSYDRDHLIKDAIRHQDTGKGITKGTITDRLTIASDIKNGLTYITLYSSENSWKKGHKIETYSIDGYPYLRIDGNKVRLDFLGELPESPIIEEPEPEPKPSPKPEPQSPRGSLPKESAEELPQELDLAPEPVTEELSPKPEEKATPEQLSRVELLEDQIDELETVISNNAKNQPSKDDSTSKNKKPKPKDIKHEITQKQNKKSDAVEKKPHLSAKKSTPSEDVPEAYCVKCKAKTKISEPEKAVMKNGRHAIKGRCSVCDCRVFRIVKMK